MKILKEHGFIEDVDYLYGYPYPILRRKYPQSKVTLYLEEHPIIKRKMKGLQPQETLELGMQKANTSCL